MLFDSSAITFISQVAVIIIEEKNKKKILGPIIRYSFPLF